MKTMKLISEEIYTNQPEIEPLEEGVNNAKRLYIQGIFAQADIKNRNGRIYPRQVLESAVQKYIEEYVSSRRALGELNHPQRITTDPKDAAIFIQELSMEGPNVYGKALVLEDLPNGKIVAGLLRNGVKLGVSTRGAGNVISEGNADKVTEFKLFAVDVVTDPSAPNAYVKGIHESIEIIEAEGVLKQKEIDRLNRMVKEDTIPDMEKVRAILEIARSINFNH